MVERMTLDHLVGVRIPVPQPEAKQSLVLEMRDCFACPGTVQHNIDRLSNEARFRWAKPTRTLRTDTVGSACTHAALAPREFNLPKTSARAARCCWCVVGRDLRAGRTSALSANGMKRQPQSQHHQHNGAYHRHPIRNAIKPAQPCKEAFALYDCNADNDQDRCQPHTETQDHR